MLTDQYICSWILLFMTDVWWIVWTPWKKQFVGMECHAVFYVASSWAQEVIDQWSARTVKRWETDQNDNHLNETSLSNHLNSYGIVYYTVFVQRIFLFSYVFTNARAGQPVTHMRSSLRLCHNSLSKCIFHANLSTYRGILKH